jgi:hypothetical protein
MLNKICTMTAKSAPYPPCTVTVLWLKYQDRDRMLRRVTQPPHIAGPLAVIVSVLLLNLPLILSTFN